LKEKAGIGGRAFPRNDGSGFRGTRRPVRPLLAGKAKARVTACTGDRLVGLFTKRLTTASVTRGRRPGGENPTPQMELTSEAGYVQAGRSEIRGLPLAALQRRVPDFVHLKRNARAPIRATG